MVKIYFLRMMLVAVLAFASIAVRATNIVVRQIPFSHLLYTNQVYDVFQDSDGYIWLGTTSSLQRWDGHRLLTFRSDSRNPHLLSDNFIVNMADTPDLLWIVSSHALTLYNKSTGEFFLPTDERIRNHHVDGICPDGNGGIWLAINQTLYHCSSSCDDIVAVDPFAMLDDKYDINDIFLDSNGELWVLCGSGLILRGHDYQYTILPPIPNGGIACTMYEDREGRFWLGTWGQGLWQYIPQQPNGKESCWLQHHILNSDTGDEESIFFCICQDTSNGWLWMLSYNKLYVFSFENNRLIQIDVSAYLPAQHYYTNMFCDREGNIWLTAYDGGYIVGFDSTGVVNYVHPQHKLQINNKGELHNIFAEGEYLWLNWQRIGLELYDRKTCQYTGLSHLGLPEITTMHGSFDSDMVWVAQRYYPKAYKLSRNDTSVTIEEVLDLQDIISDSHPIDNIIEEHDGTLWMLVRNHLVVRLLDLNNSVITADLERPTAMTFSKKDDALLCVDNRYIFRCVPYERHIACRPVASLDFLYDGEDVVSIAAEVAGNVWLATSLGRIYRSDIKMEHFEPAPVDTLFHDGLVQDMLINGNSVWVMNDKRIVQYSTVDSALTCYEAATGNVELKGFRHHALCLDSVGVLAGGSGGFVYLPDKRKQHSARHLTPALSDVLIDGESLYFGEKNTEKSTFERIVLPSDAHNIEFHLSLLTYITDCLPRIQYRLKGAESYWSELDNIQCVAHYSSLPSGKYDLQMRIYQDGGEWGPPMNIASVERLPAWYESNFACLCYILLLVSFLSAVVWYVRRRHANQMQTEVMQAKVAIITAEHKITDEMIAIIDRHLGDSDFGLEQLLTEMNMSKSTLYRQLKSETDMTPSDLIRSVRMKRACEMLISHKKTVSEVAYAIGFSTPKYFTRCFKDVYGMTPTDYIRSHSSVTTSVDDTA